MDFVYKCTRKQWEDVLNSESAPLNSEADEMYVSEKMKPGQLHYLVPFFGFKSTDTAESLIIKRVDRDSSGRKVFVVDSGKLD